MHFLGADKMIFVSDSILNTFMCSVCNPFMQIFFVLGQVYVFFIQPLFDTLLNLDLIVEYYCESLIHV